MVDTDGGGMGEAQKGRRMTLLVRTNEDWSDRSAAGCTNASAGEAHTNSTRATISVAAAAPAKRDAMVNREC